jgi:hypothetical protein
LPVPTDLVAAFLKKSSGYLTQPSVQPFFFGHKLQFLIEKNFFFGFDGEPGEASTRISAG